ncbi:MAG: hypothetical protein WC773_00465 [Patescibacteria group bacterium]|jgi:hypothetical protein
MATIAFRKKGETAELPLTGIVDPSTVTVCDTAPSGAPVAKRDRLQYKLVPVPEGTLRLRIPVVQIRSSQLYDGWMTAREFWDNHPDFRGAILNVDSGLRAFSVINTLFARFEDVWPGHPVPADILAARQEIAEEKRLAAAEEVARQESQRSWDAMLQKTHDLIALVMGDIPEIVRHQNEYWSFSVSSMERSVSLHTLIQGVRFYFVAKHNDVQVAARRVLALRDEWRTSPPGGFVFSPDTQTYWDLKEESWSGGWRLDEWCRVAKWLREQHEAAEKAATAEEAEERQWLFQLRGIMIPPLYGEQLVAVPMVDSRACSPNEANWWGLYTPDGKPYLIRRGIHVRYSSLEGLIRNHYRDERGIMEEALLLLSSLIHSL